MRDRWTTTVGAGPRALALLAAAIVLGAIPGFTAPAAVGAVVTPATAHTMSGQEQEVLALTNAARAVARTCGSTSFPAAGPLTWNDTLGAVALAHSTDMATRNFFAHTNPDGLTPFQRMAAAGYLFVSAGENLGLGYPSAREVVDGWISSPGHCENLMSPSFTEIGVGFFRGVGPLGYYWTQDFGAREILWVDEGAATTAISPPALAGVDPQTRGSGTPAGVATATIVRATHHGARIHWSVAGARGRFRVRVVDRSGHGSWHTTTRTSRTFSHLHHARSYQFQLRYRTAAGVTSTLTLDFTTA